MMSINTNYLRLLPGLLLLSACSSNVPREISQSLTAAPGVAQVLSQPDNYLGQKVRWGGAILTTENKENTSRLTIIAFPLNDNGEPQLSDQTPGRFIAIVDEFLEPLVYKNDRNITFIGTVLRSESQLVGEFTYAYPVIQVEHYFLWPVKQQSNEADYPPYWWYDPWYNPYYPWHRPYYPRR